MLLANWSNLYSGEFFAGFNFSESKLVSVLSNSTDLKDRRSLNLSDQHDAASPNDDSEDSQTEVEDEEENVTEASPGVRLRTKRGIEPSSRPASMLIELHEQVSAMVTISNWSFMQLTSFSGNKKVRGVDEEQLRGEEREHEVQITALQI